MSQDLAMIEAPEEHKASVAACVQWSAANVINSPEKHRATLEHCKQTKRELKVADAFFDPPIEQAHRLWKLLLSRKKLVAEPLAESEGIDKKKALAWEEAELVKSKAEADRLNAAAAEASRKEREKAEQAAVKQRAIEEEARRKSEEARRKAEATANEAKRAKLLEEAAAAERKASSAAAKAEAKEDQAASVVTPVIPPAAPTKIEGVTTRRQWTATVTDRKAFLLWVCEHKRIELIEPAQKTLDALARGLKQELVADGLLVEEKTTMGVRA